MSRVEPLKIVFRVDASMVIGTGHWMRCLTLAEGLQPYGCQVTFLTADVPPALADMLPSSGITLQRISDEAAGLAWLSDQPKPVDWLVLDHYGLDIVWEQAVRACTRRLMVLDDLAERDFDCDLLLNPNTQDAALYRDKIPKHARLLLGPGYALLRPEFSHLPQKSTLTQINHVAVGFGGSDPTHETARVLQALLNPHISSAIRALHWTVIAGAANPDWEHLGALAQQLTLRGIQLTLYRSVNHMAQCMASADLWIGAGGASTWERYATGLYCLLISVARNQDRLCERVEQDQMGRYLGRSDEVTGDDILMQAIQALLDDPSPCAHAAIWGPQQVDGLGTERVLQALLTC